jgi:rhodanese-related sulfurtransferase
LRLKIGALCHHPDAGLLCCTTVLAMQIGTQILHISAAGVALSLLVAAVRGLPERPVARPVSGSCGGGGTEWGFAAAAVGWISPEEARGLLTAGTVAFVDCRSEPEFLNGHVSGALHVPAESASLGEEVLQRLRGVGTVITYCDAGEACENSQRLATLLSQTGLPDVRVMRGGLPAWLSHGYPAESGSCPLCTSTN